MTVNEQEIARYVGQVREALADLPPTVRDELLEDLPEHLVEVAAEGDGSLVERLGSPAAYATELRTAAGASPPGGTPNLDQRIGAVLRRNRDRLRTADGRLGPVIGYARLSDFLRLLRPAWWILRGYLVAMFVTVLFKGTSFGLLPRLDGSNLTALLLLAATVTGSIWLGRRTDRLGRRPKWVLHLSSALLVLFGLVGFVEADNLAGGGGSVVNYQQVYTDQYSGIQDVYVYDSEGRLLEGVRLFDQNGQPIRLGTPWCTEVNQRVQVGPAYVDPTRLPYPYCPEGAPFRWGPTPTPTPTLTPSAPVSTAPATPAPTPSTTSSAIPTGTPDPTGAATSTPTG